MLYYVYTVLLQYTAIHCNTLHQLLLLILIVGHMIDGSVDALISVVRIPVKALTRVLLTSRKALDCRGTLILLSGRISYIHSNCDE